MSFVICFTINSKIDTFVEEYKFLWDFKHHSDQPADEIKIISSLKNNGELLTFHNNKSLWDGCFGGMCIIKYDFLHLCTFKTPIFPLFFLLIQAFVYVFLYPNVFYNFLH